MDDLVSAPSRRTLLGSLALAPIVAGRAVAGVAPDSPTPAVLHGPPDDPIVLRRTTEGRELSLVRYQTAVEFFPCREAQSKHGRADFFYNAGVTAQLGLSSHLLDVGVDDDWCARNIGYRPTLALAYANKLGFGYDCPQTGRLARVLTPYWKWNALSIHERGSPSDGGFTPDRIAALLHALLDHVGRVTGHGHG